MMHRGDLTKRPISAATGSRNAAPHNKMKKLNWTFFLHQTEKRILHREYKGRPGPRSLPRCRTAFFSIFREGSEWIVWDSAWWPRGFRIREIFRCAPVDSSQTLPRPCSYSSIGSRVCNKTCLEFTGRGSLIYLSCSIDFVIHPFLVFYPISSSVSSSVSPPLAGSHHLPPHHANCGICGLPINSPRGAYF